MNIENRKQPGAVSPSPPPVISQAELGSLITMERAISRYQHERARVMELVDAGVEIEPGYWTANVRRTERKIVTTDLLRIAIGADKAADLLEYIPPTEVADLEIVAKPLAAHRHSVPEWPPELRPRPWVDCDAAD